MLESIRLDIDKQVDIYRAVQNNTVKKRRKANVIRDKTIADLLAATDFENENLLDILRTLGYQMQGFIDRMEIAHDASIRDTSAEEAEDSAIGNVEV